MKEESYYKQLKAHKQSLRGKGWLEQTIEETGKKKHRWMHPDLPSQSFSLHGALKADNHREVSDHDIDKIKETINSLIDVISGIESEVNYLREKLEEN